MEKFSIETHLSIENLNRPLRHVFMEQEVKNIFGVKLIYEITYKAKNDTNWK